jgi:hypothetical protein
MLPDHGTLALAHEMGNYLAVAVEASDLSATEWRLENLARPRG